LEIIRDRRSKRKSLQDCKAARCEKLGVEPHGLKSIFQTGKPISDLFKVEVSID